MTVLSSWFTSVKVLSSWFWISPVWQCHRRDSPVWKCYHLDSPVWQCHLSWFISVTVSFIILIHHQCVSVIISVTVSLSYPFIFTEIIVSKHFDANLITVILTVITKSDLKIMDKIIKNTCLHHEMCFKTVEILPRNSSYLKAECVFKAQVP